MAVEKTLRIESTPEGAYIVKWNGGGQIPDVLKGIWTSKHMLEQAIQTFKDGVRGKVNAKTKRS